MKFTADQKEAIADLRKLIKPGATVYHYCDHVSPSGMTRTIKFFVVKDGKLVCIDWYMARVCGYKQSHIYNGLIITGCGMDMGFAAVYSLASRLFKSTKGEDAGYKLKSQWI